VLGEDSDALGGPEPLHEFLALAQTGPCGKLKVLDALMQEWHAEPGANNKVCLGGGVGCVCWMR
jgi:hypothetical protein